MLTLFLVFAVVPRFLQKFPGIFKQFDYKVSNFRNSSGKIFFSYFKIFFLKNFMAFKVLYIPSRILVSYCETILLHTLHTRTYICKHTWLPWIACFYVRLLVSLIILTSSVSCNFSFQPPTSINTQTHHAHVLFFFFCSYLLAGLFLCLSVYLFDRQLTSL